MDYKIQVYKHHQVAVLDNKGTVIHNEQAALDFMVAAGSEGAEAIILHEQQLPAEFFDLSTGLAGAILQKFANYRVKLAIIGSFKRYQSRSLAAFMRESNRGNLIFFVPDLETAISSLFPEAMDESSTPQET